MNQEKTLNINLRKKNIYSIVFILFLSNLVYGQRVEFWEKSTFSLPSDIVTHHVDTILQEGFYKLPNNAKISYTALDSLVENKIYRDWICDKLYISLVVTKQLYFKKEKLNIAKFHFCNMECANVLYCKGIGIFYVYYHHRGPKLILKQIKGSSTGNVVDIPLLIEYLERDTCFFPPPPPMPDIYKD